MKAQFLPVWATGILFSFLILMSCKDHFDNNNKGQFKTYLLVHGANHGAWAWEKIVPILKAQGHRVLTIDLPGHGKDQTPPENVKLDDYVGKVVDVANLQNGPVILVGHSAGGVTIAQAGEKLGTTKVEKLIFLDAFLPKNGESVFSLAAKFLPPANNGELNFADIFIFDQQQTTFTLDTAKVDHFLYHDCSVSDVLFAKSNLSKQPVAPFATPIQVTDTVYGAIPKYFIICSEARNGNMSAMATNMPLQKIFTLPSSHSPFFSMPEKLVEILNEIK